MSGYFNGDAPDEEFNEDYDDPQKPEEDENVESDHQEDTQPPQEEGKKTDSEVTDSQLSIHKKRKTAFSFDEPYQMYYLDLAIAQNYWDFNTQKAAAKSLVPMFNKHYNLDEDHGLTEKSALNYVRGITSKVKRIQQHDTYCTSGTNQGMSELDEKIIEFLEGKSRKDAEDKARQQAKEIVDPNVIGSETNINLEKLGKKLESSDYQNTKLVKDFAKYEERKKKRALRENSKRINKVEITKEKTAQMYERRESMVEGLQTVLRKAHEDDTISLKKELSNEIDKKLDIFQNTMISEQKKQMNEQRAELKEMLSSLFGATQLVARSNDPESDIVHVERSASEPVQDPMNLNFITGDHEKY